jgi:uncharacterized protein (DUF2344 family)
MLSVHSFVIFMLTLEYDFYTIKHKKKWHWKIIKIILVHQGVLEPVRNGSAEEVHQNCEQVIKVFWYQTKSGQTLQSKHSAQRRNYETNLHSEKKAKVLCVTDNRTCEPLMTRLAVPRCPSSVLQHCSDSVNSCVSVSAAMRFNPTVKP